MEEWKLRRLILTGKARRIVFNSLGDKPKLSKEISSKTKLVLSNVIRILNEFEKSGLAKNLTPSEKRNRVWTLTENGKRLAKELKENV